MTWQRVATTAALILVSALAGATAGHLSADRQSTPSPEPAQPPAPRGPAGPPGPRGTQGERGPAGRAGTTGTTYHHAGEPATLIDENITPVATLTAIPHGDYVVLASARVDGAPRHGFAASCAVRARARDRTHVIATFDSDGTGVTDTVHTVHSAAPTSTFTLSCVRRSTEPVRISDARLTAMRVRVRSAGG